MATENIKSEDVSGTLFVKLVGARNLPAMDVAGSSDPYVKFEVPGDKKSKKKSKTVKKSLSPQWNESFEFNIPTAYHPLELTMYDWDRVSKDDVIGSLTLSIDDFRRSTNEEQEFSLKPSAESEALLKGVPEQPKITLQLRFEETEKKDGGDDDEKTVLQTNVENVQKSYLSLKSKHTVLVDRYEQASSDVGELKTGLKAMQSENTQYADSVEQLDRVGRSMRKFVVEEKLSEQSVEGAKVHVELVRAENLPAMDRGGTSDPFVKLSLTNSKQAFKSKVIKKTLKPHWNESFSFDLSNALQDVVLEVFDRDAASKDDIIGTHSLSFGKLRDCGADPQQDRWLRLNLGAEAAEKTGDMSGLALHEMPRVLVRVTYEDAPVADRQGDVDASPAAPAKQASSSGAGATQVERDVDVVQSEYRQQHKQLDVLKTDLEELQSEHTHLATSHAALETTHTETTEKLQTLKKDHDEVGDLVSEFLQATPALSAAAAAGKGTDRPGKLQVKVLEARGLPAMDKSTKSSDPFVQLTLNEQSEKTDIKKKTLEPTWNEDFTFNVTSALQSLRLEVFDWDRMGKNETIGECVLPVRRFHDLVEASDRWYALKPTDGSKGESELGEVHLSISFADEGPVASAEAKDDEQPSHSPLYKDTDVVLNGYKGLDQDHKILAEDHSELTETHVKLQADHVDLTKRHDTLTNEHTQLSIDHNQVGDLLSEFVQATPALSEAAASGGDQKGVLWITVAEARGLPIMDKATKSSDPFVTLCLGEQTEKTETIKKSLEPKWNQDFSFDVSSTFAQLRIEVFDWDRMSNNDLIGECLLPLRRFQGLSEPLDRWYKLTPAVDGDVPEGVPAGEVRLIARFEAEKKEVEDNDDASGDARRSPVYRDADGVVTGYKAIDQDFKILTEDHSELTSAHDQLAAEHDDLTHKHDRLTEVHSKLSTDYDQVGDMTKEFIVEQKISLEKVSGIARVKLVEARDLPKMDAKGLSDPFAHISVKDQLFKTERQEKTLNPTWNLDYEFKIDSALDELIVDLFDWDRFSKNDFMGRVVVPFRRLRDSPRDRVIWFPLRDIDNKGKVQGEVALSFAYESLIETPEWSLGDVVKASRGNDDVTGTLLEECGDRLKLRVSQPSELHPEPLEANLYFNKDVCKRQANSQLQRDVSAVHTQHRATAKELSDLTVEHTELSEAHDTLTVAHDVLTADHEVLTVQHTDLSTKTSAVASSVQQFIAEHEIPTSDVKAKLKLKLVSASNLAKMDIMGKSDPLVELTLGNQETESPVVKKSLDPVWNFDVEFDVTSRIDPLRLTVFDWDRTSGNDFMGSVTIPFHQFREYAVQTKKPKSAPKLSVPSKEIESKVEEEKESQDSEKADVKVEEEVQVAASVTDEVEEAQKARSDVSVGEEEAEVAPSDEVADADSDDSFDSPDVVDFRDLEPDQVQDVQTDATSNDVPKESEPDRSLQADDKEELVEESKDEADHPAISFDVSIDTDDERDFEDGEDEDGDADWTPKGPIRLRLPLMDRDGQVETQGELELEISYFDFTNGGDESGAGSSNELLSEVNFVHKSFVALDTEHRDLVSDHATLKSDHDELMAGFERMKERLADAEDELDDNKRQLVTSQHDLAKEKAHNETKIRELNNEHKQEMVDLQKKMEKQFEEELRKWMNSLNDVTKDKKEVEKTLDSTEVKVKVSEEKIAELEERIKNKKCLIM